MSPDSRSSRITHGRCEIDFQLELSRGASCISSCRTDESLHKLVQETLDSFLETHGPERFLPFRSLLAQRVIARDRPDAAVVISSYPVPKNAGLTFLQCEVDLSNAVFVTAR